MYLGSFWGGNSEWEEGTNGSNKLSSSSCFSNNGRGFILDYFPRAQMYILIVHNWRGIGRERWQFNIIGGLNLLVIICI